MTTLDNIMEVTRRLIKEVGLINVTCELVCSKAGIPMGSFKRVAGVSFSDFILDFDWLKSEVLEVTRKRADADLRKDQILNTAINLAEKSGYNIITRSDVARHAKVSPGLVTHYFGTVEELRYEVIKKAIKSKVLRIIAQALLLKDPLIANISTELKNQAVSIIKGV